MMVRRAFLAGAAATAATGSAQGATRVDDIPIVDTHFHIFDARRPQGVPYAGSDVWERERKGVALT